MHLVFNIAYRQCAYADGLVGRKFEHLAHIVNINTLNPERRYGINVSGHNHLWGLPEMRPGQYLYARLGSAHHHIRYFEGPEYGFFRSIIHSLHIYIKTFVIFIRNFLADPLAAVRTQKNICPATGGQDARTDAYGTRASKDMHIFARQSCPGFSFQPGL